MTTHRIPRHSKPAGAFIGNVFELATGGVRIVFVHIEES
jgi:hypothetical protein